MAGTLVILRHGQSVWNEANLFTGWHDVELTERGRAEAVATGETLAAEGMRFDTSHTSLLTDIQYGLDVADDQRSDELAYQMGLPFRRDVKSSAS